MCGLLLRRNPFTPKGNPPLVDFSPGEIQTCMQMRISPREKSRYSVELRISPQEKSIYYQGESPIRGFLPGRNPNMLQMWISHGEKSTHSVKFRISTQEKSIYSRGKSPLDLSRGEIHQWGISPRNKWISPGEKSEIQRNVLISPSGEIHICVHVWISPGEKSTNGGFPQE